MIDGDLKRLRECVAGFVQLSGTTMWSRRIAHLRRELEASPFRAKLVVDYNWLEVVLGSELELVEAGGPAPPVAAEALAALYFAQTVIHAHEHLSVTGRKQLEGRLHDALQSDTGFSSLYLEMDVARRLLEAGYEVEFADLDRVAQYDLRFWTGAIEGEVECKSLSTDAGRKIHRREFYRFIDAIAGALTTRMTADVREVVVITLEGRMPADDAQQGELRTATATLLADGGCGQLTGTFFTIAREEYDRNLGLQPTTTTEGFYERCRELYGNNCHVSGGYGETGCCFIVVRSRREDDHSAPQLEALRKAASQFSGQRPGFIAVQYDDITVQDLLQPQLRRRAGLLSYYLFLKDRASHVAATCFSIYGGISASGHGICVPSFAVPNPESRFPARPADYGPFLGHIPDDEFARLVGGPVPAESISWIPFDPASPNRDPSPSGG
jgi:hypothetical protein